MALGAAKLRPGFINFKSCDQVAVCQNPPLNVDPNLATIHLWGFVYIMFTPSHAPSPFTQHKQQVHKCTLEPQVPKLRASCGLTKSPFKCFPSWPQFTHTVLLNGFIALAHCHRQPHTSTICIDYASSTMNISTHCLAISVECNAAAILPPPAYIQ